VENKLHWRVCTLLSNFYGLGNCFVERELSCLEKNGVRSPSGETLCEDRGGGRRRGFWMRLRGRRWALLWRIEAFCHSVPLLWLTEIFRSLQLQSCVVIPCSMYFNIKNVCIFAHCIHFCYYILQYKKIYFYQTALTDLLTMQNPLVTWCTNSLTLNNCTFCLHCIYVFCIYLRTNSDLCHLQHKLIGFYNRDEKCLHRGTDWVFNP